MIADLHMSLLWYGEASATESEYSHDQGTQPQLLILQLSSSWKLVATLPLQGTGECTAMAFSADGSLLGALWQGGSCTLQLWDWRKVSLQNFNCNVIQQ